MMEMSNYLIFKSDSRFYDDKNFPYGFDRAGIFTRAEVELLHDCGRVLEALELGTQPPLGEEQERFVKVCNGQEVAESSVEKTWMKYRITTSVEKLKVSCHSSTPFIDAYSGGLDDLL